MMPTTPLVEQPAPSAIETTLRGVGRLLARVVALASIAVAGVAGWIVTEQYAFPEVSGAYAEPVNVSPWPDEFARPRTTWDSFTLTYAIDGANTHRTSFDSTTDLVRLTYFGPAGVTSEVELAGLRSYERVAGSSDWVRAAEDETNRHIHLGVRGIAPVHLSALVPPEAFPFVDVSESSAPTSQVDGVRRFEVTIDVPGLRAADPLAVYRWARRQMIDPDLAGSLRWVVDVRADGWVVNWEGRSASVETWSDYPADLVFESPLATTAPAPTTTVPG